MIDSGFTTSKIGTNLIVQLKDRFKWNLRGQNLTFNLGHPLMIISIHSEWINYTLIRFHWVRAFRKYKSPVLNFSWLAIQTSTAINPQSKTLNFTKKKIPFRHSVDCSFDSRYNYTHLSLFFSCFRAASWSVGESRF